MRIEKVFGRISLRTIIVVTTNVLFCKLSTISVIVSVKFLVIFTPELSLQWPTSGRNIYCRSQLIHFYIFLTRVNPSLFSSMISNSKSDLWPLWSNFILPVSPFISIWTKQRWRRRLAWPSLPTSWSWPGCCRASKCTGRHSSGGWCRCSGRDPVRGELWRTTRLHRR